MRVLEDELVNYLGNDLSGLEGKLRSKTLEKLRRYDKYTTGNFYLPAIDYLLLAHQQGNKGMDKLAKEVGITATRLTRIFDYLSLPRLTNAELLTIWNEESVIKKLQEEASGLGYSPRESDVGGGLYSAAVSVFGSWNRAKKAAGLVTYQQRGPREKINGSFTVSSRIRGYLNNNPATYGEVRAGLNLHRLKLSLTLTAGVRSAGSQRHQIYYLVGQEHLLPLEYQNSSLPTLK